MVKDGEQVAHCRLGNCESSGIVSGHPLQTLAIRSEVCNLPCNGRKGRKMAQGLGDSHSPSQRLLENVVGEIVPAQGAHACPPLQAVSHLVCNISSPLGTYAQLNQYSRHMKFSKNIVKNPTLTSNTEISLTSSECNSPYILYIKKYLKKCSTKQRQDR